MCKHLSLQWIIVYELKTKVNLIIFNIGRKDNDYFIERKCNNIAFLENVRLPMEFSNYGKTLPFAVRTSSLIQTGMTNISPKMIYKFSGL